MNATIAEKAKAASPRRGKRLDGGFRVVAAVGMAGYYAALIFARLWRPDFRTESWSHASLSLLAFYIDTFTFHGGVALLLVSLLLAAARWWRLVLAAVPAVVFTVGPSLLRYCPRAAPSIAGQSLKVMSVNLLAFNPRTEGIVSEIEAADPDFLCIQEYNQHWHEAISAKFGERYPYVFTVPRTDCFGLALYSKLPLEEPVNTNLHLGGVNLPAMRAVVRFHDRPIVVYNLHLVPPYGVGQHRAQGRQVADLLERVESETRPVILAGDFNFTSESRFARALAGLGFRDASDLGGRGRQSTWPVTGLLRYVPGIRIDHIYLSRGLTCSSSRTGAGQGSDHRPVMIVLGFQP